MRLRGLARRVAKEMKMSVLDTPSTASHAAQARAVAIAAAARVTAALRGLARALLHRRHLGELRDLSDRGLADIGLMRGDLDFAQRTPFSVDPTARLASVARERVSARRD